MGRRLAAAAAAKRAWLASNMLVSFLQSQRRLQPFLLHPVTRQLERYGYHCVCVLVFSISQIVAVGPDVPTNGSFKIGQRVCVENHYYCGECYQCTHGKPVTVCL